MTSTTAHFFAVGGIVRDTILGIPSKDVDFSVVIPSMKGRPAAAGFAAMADILTGQGFEICKESPATLNIVAKVPRDHPLAAWGSKTCDFVLARQDGPSSNGRHPDWVETADLSADLARRDFTVNSLAVIAGDITATGEFIGPAFTPGRGLNIRDHVLGSSVFSPGLDDLDTRTLRFVGEPEQRLREDWLRALRALRFTIVKGFEMTPDTVDAINTRAVAAGLLGLSADRIRGELLPMFRKDTLGTLTLLQRFPLLQTVCFSNGLRLEATLAK